MIYSPTEIWKIDRSICTNSNEYTTEEKHQFLKWRDTIKEISQDPAGHLLDSIRYMDDVKEFRKPSKIPYIKRTNHERTRPN